MDRKDFLVKLGIGTAAICINCFWGCQDNPASAPAAPENVDFTLDLAAQENGALKNNGGAVYKNGLIVGRVNATTYVALSQACTHQGTTVQFDLNNNRMHCPNHGSNFNFDGGVINGPAASALRKYNTSLNGDMLRIFS